MVKKGLGATSLDDDEASALAIDALSYIASDTVLFNRFLRLTGLELENLREAADEPTFLAGVLDFILGDERTLEGFVARSNIEPEKVAAARQVLGTGYAESYS